jgi:hypothetical protein
MYQGPRGGPKPRTRRGSVMLGKMNDANDVSFAD